MAATRKVYWTGSTTTVYNNAPGLGTNNIASGDTMNEVFSKIRQNLGGLKSVAFGHTDDAIITTLTNWTDLIQLNGTAVYNDPSTWGTTYSGIIIEFILKASSSSQVQYRMGPPFVLPFSTIIYLYETSREGSTSPFYIGLANAPGDTNAYATIFAGYQNSKFVIRIVKGPAAASWNMSYQFY